MPVHYLQKKYLIILLLVIEILKQDFNKITVEEK